MTTGSIRFSKSQNWHLEQAWFPKNENEGFIPQNIFFVIYSQMAVNEGFLLGTYEEVYLSKFGRKLQIYNTYGIGTGALV